MLVRDTTSKSLDGNIRHASDEGSGEVFGLLEQGGEAVCLLRLHRHNS